MTTRMKARDDRQATSPAQQAVMGAALLLTAGLLGYTAWQAWTAPAEAMPRAEVGEVVEDERGRSVVVRFWNDGGVGVLRATVEVTCGEAAETLEFEHVPANGRQVGIVRCDEGEPRARVVAWAQA